MSGVRVSQLSRPSQGDTWRRIRVKISNDNQLEPCVTLGRLADRSAVQPMLKENVTFSPQSVQSRVDVAVGRLLVYTLVATHL